MDIYRRTVDWTALNTCVMFCDLYIGGRRCKQFKIGVTCSCLWVPVTSQAAEFFTVCRCLELNKRALKQSSQDVIKSCTCILQASVIIYSLAESVLQKLKKGYKYTPKFFTNCCMDNLLLKAGSWALSCWFCNKLIFIYKRD